MSKNKNKKNAKTNKEEAVEEASPFQVKDKRFWANESTDTDVEELAADRPLAAVKKLQDQLRDSEEKITKLGLALRAQRDEQQQIAQRHQRSLEQELLNLKVNLFGQLLEVMDNLDRCVESIEQKADDSDYQSTCEGVRLVQQQFLKTLQTCGVEKLSLQGTAFDPQKAEAIGVEELSNQQKDGMVVREFRSGFEIAGRLIRPARVQVGRYVEPNQQTSQKG